MYKKHTPLKILINMLLFCCLSVSTKSQALKVQHDLIVAQDGSGDFRTIQAAIDAIRVYLPKPIKVLIRKGIYNEKISVPSTLTNISFIGEDSTVITYNDYSGKGKMDTFDSYTFKLMGNDIVLDNLIITNTAGRVGQAVALHIEGDRCIIRKCRLLGNQDTVFSSGENARQYFQNCYIEGTTDFIFGSASALFENCEIHSKMNSFITAASTPEWVNYGFVFKNCRLTADSGVDKVYLGRPWRDFAQTVFINCEMGAHILGVGWDNWQRVNTEKTAFFAEYNNTGQGFKPKERVRWSHQLSSKEAKKYELMAIFSGFNKPAFKEFWLKKP